MIFNVKYLDIVITRSCQLDCQGCLTFSNHNKVKGHTDLDGARDWLSIWAKRLKPEQIHLFGGEPLMHPRFMPWATTVCDLFGLLDLQYNGTLLHIQTNGIKLSSLTDCQLDTLINKRNVKFNITLHSNESWYRAIIDPQIERLVTILGSGEWIQDRVVSIYKNTVGNYFKLTAQTEATWISHYKGYGKTLEPGWDFTSDRYTQNHGYCEAKPFIQMVDGSLYKCPPMGVLLDTLKTYNYPNKEKWQGWIDYQPLPVTCTDEELAVWLHTQARPEKYCNLCFGESQQSVPHRIKIKND